MKRKHIRDPSLGSNNMNIRPLPWVKSLQSSPWRSLQIAQDVIVFCFWYPGGCHPGKDQSPHTKGPNVSSV